MKRWLYCLVASALVLSGVRLAKAADPSPEQLEFFEKKIRPVLAESCYSCHSVKAKENKKLKGKLYLDSFEGMAKGGSSEKPAVVPGKPDDSLLIKAIHYKFTGDDEEMNMPPKKKDGTGGKLPDAVIADFEKWIKDGAAHPKEFDKAPSANAGSPDGKTGVAEADKPHWAFVKPTASPLPAVKTAGWASNGIDPFIASKLEAKGAAPNPQADRRTLIRRATFDLTGVPPTPEEVDAFLNDNSPDAFAKVIDRLLASPRYGERWARHWLDVSRYADTKGYVFQEERKYPYAYTYRDWVIRALNADTPYDLFLVKQIAADQLQAKGQLPEKSDLAAMGFLTLGRRFLNNQADIIDDRLDVVCRGTMGVTIGCARCHDHKFDPVPTKDYYGLYGVFASSVEPKDLPQIAEPDGSPASQAFNTELKSKQQAVEDFLTKRSKEIVDATRTAKGLSDYLQAAANPPKDNGSDAAAADLSRYLIQRWRESLAKSAASKDSVFAAWRLYAALPAGEFAAKSDAVLQQISGKAKSPVASNPLIADALAAKKPKNLAEVAAVYGDVLAKFDKPETLKDANEEALRQVLRGPASPLAVPDADRTKLFKRDSRDALTKLQRKVDEFQASNPNAPAKAMVMVDGPTPRDMPVLLRGNPGSPGPIAPRQFLSAISSQPIKLTEGSGRLQLAQAIASKDNPLTARVIVNRVWAWHFGQGIVRTPSDFGTRSDPPSHPELLDSLAVKFMEDGWSLKKLHRTIMLSKTYQQTSDDNAAARKVDPENLLLGHFQRQRLGWESTRDSLLSVSGKMDEKPFGQPVDITNADNTRRSIYGFIDRQNLPGLFRAFDFASPDTTSPQRFVTTVPQQALFFMNSPFVRMQAKRLLERDEISKAADPAERIKKLYRLLYQRDPSVEEAEIGKQFVASEDAPAKPAVVTWQYGFGRYDETTKRTAEFTPLPLFTGTAWQGSQKLPSSKTGWVLLNAQGGHAGNDAAHAAVRRWTAASDGTIDIGGQLAHATDNGDGVRGRIVSSRHGLLGEWTVHNSKTAAAASKIEVKAGDTIDFVVDCIATVTSDGFSWAPVIKQTTGTAKGAKAEWSASSEFGGPSSVVTGMAPWEKYVQVLLEANEFVFVD